MQPETIMMLSQVCHRLKIFSCMSDVLIRAEKHYDQIYITHNKLNLTEPASNVSMFTLASLYHKIGYEYLEVSV